MVREGAETVGGFDGEGSGGAGEGEDGVEVWTGGAGEGLVRVARGR